MSWKDLPSKTRRNIFLIIFAIFFLITVIRVAPALISSLGSGQDTNPQVAGSNSRRVDINREFEFPLKDSSGESTEMAIKYIVESADLTDKIIVKGQQATAADNRLFLILNIKLENPTQAPLSIKTRDFIRVTPEGSADRLAPDIHNDPTEVQPISTKLTRVGFPVSASIKNFTLYVGEINGEKQEISLNF